MRGKKRHVLLLIVILICVSGWILSQSSSFKKIDQNLADSQEIEAAKNLFRDSSGFPYPYGADTFYYMRLAENILEKGHPGGVIKDSQPYTTLRLAPKGLPAPHSIYPYIFAAFHKIISAGRDLPLDITAYWLPIILGIASVLLVFFLGKTLFNTMTGFYSALILSFHPFFITWNYAGFADTNAINMFFSLLILFAALKAKKNYVWWGLALFTLILFFNTWKGAFYILAVFAFIAAAIAITRTKSLLLVLGSATLLGVLIFKYGSLVKERLIPSTITAQHITELRPVTFPELIQGTGGKIIFVITVVALILIIINIFKDKKNAWKYAALLAWFTPLCIAGILSRRFLFYAAPPTALILGVFWERIRSEGMILLKKIKLPQKKHVLTVLTVLAIPLLLWNSIHFLQQLLPSANDALVESLHFIRESTDEDTIIATRWDRGYLVQYFARRGTLVDPGTPYHQRINSIAEFFWAKDEHTAGNSLKHLNCGRDLGINLSCPPGIVMVDEGMLAAIGMQKLVAPEIKTSKISKCSKTKEIIMCDNGFKIIGNNATRDNGFPKRFDDYRGKGKRTINYNVTNDVAFILYDTEQGLYSFMITEAYTDAMLPRFIAQDSFDNFTLIYRTEFPEQIYIYDIK